MPIFRPGSVIHAFHRLSHGRRRGWLVSRDDALTRMPRPVSASIVPRQTWVSLLRCWRRCFGISPTNGHAAQQSGFSGGRVICTMFLFGIAFGVLTRMSQNYMANYMAIICFLFHTNCHELPVNFHKFPENGRFWLGRDFILV